MNKDGYGGLELGWGKVARVEGGGDVAIDHTQDSHFPFCNYPTSTATHH